MSEYVLLKHALGKSHLNPPSKRLEQVCRVTCPDKMADNEVKLLNKAVKRKMPSSILLITF